MIHLEIVFVSDVRYIRSFIFSQMANQLVVLAPFIKGKEIATLPLAASIFAPVI